MDIPTSPITPKNSREIKLPPSIKDDNDVKEFQRAIHERSMMNSPFQKNDALLGWDTPVRMTTIEREQKKDAITNTWVCCSENVDRRLLQYLVQFFIAIVVLTFCAVKLAGSCENTEVYLVLFSSIMGYYLNGGAGILEFKK